MEQLKNLRLSKQVEALTVQLQQYALQAQSGPARGQLRSSGWGSPSHARRSTDNLSGSLSFGTRPSSAYDGGRGSDKGGRVLLASHSGGDLAGTSSTSSLHEGRLDYLELRDRLSGTMVQLSQCNAALALLQDVLQAQQSRKAEAELLCLKLTLLMQTSLQLSPQLNTMLLPGKGSPDINVILKRLQQESDPEPEREDRSENEPALGEVMSLPKRVMLVEHNLITATAEYDIVNLLFMQYADPVEQAPSGDSASARGDSPLDALAITHDRVVISTQLFLPVAHELV
jgi:hypothetical protein